MPSFRPHPAVFLLLLGLLAGPGWAAAGKNGFSFLTASPAASAVGAAGALAAQTGDPAALYCNPAGLARLAAEEASLHSQSGLQDVTQGAVSYVRPAGRGGWGVAAGFLAVGGLTKTRVDPSSPDGFSTEGSLRAGDQYLAAALARPWTEDGAWGADVKVVKEDLDTRSAAVLALDAGVVRRLDAEWRLGAAVRNLGTPARFSSEKSPPPARFQLGARYQSVAWADWEADLAKDFRGDGELLAGGRFSWNDAAFLRLGYQLRFRRSGLGALSGAAAGLGGRWGAFAADYAVRPFGDLGWTHTFTVSWRL
jgi:hypothetical protein